MTRKPQFFKKQDFQDVGFNLHDIFPEREEGLKVTTFGEEERQTPGPSRKNWVTVLISRSPFHLYKVLVSLYVKYGS